MGLGLTTKLLFLWFWLALGAAWLLLSRALEPRAGREAWLWPMRRLSWRSFLFASLALIAGLAPLLAYNLTGLGTVSTVLQNARQTELYGVNNLDLIRNLGEVFGRDLTTLLEGTWFRASFGAAHRNPLAVPALLAALAVILWLMFRNRLPYSRTRVLLLLILFITIVVQSAVTITGLGAPHLMILWPIPQALVAIAICSAPRFIPQRIGLAALPVALTLVLVGGEAWTTFQYYRTLAITGGRGTFSDSIGEVARDLSKEGTLRPIALDWGFRRSIQLLTGGGVNPEERFDYGPQPSEAFDAYINDTISLDSRAGTTKVYLFHAPKYTQFPGHWEHFEEAAYRYGLTPVATHVYRQRNGDPVSMIYRLEPTPPLQGLPPGATPIDVRLGDGLRLLGYQVQDAPIRAGDVVSATLYWQAQKAQGVSYKVFAHLIGPAGQLVGQQDSIPRLWGHPTTEWKAGEIVADRVRIEVKGDATAGQYGLFVGMYHAATGQRLPLYLRDKHLEGDTVRLQDATVLGK
jgi:hypothetical protein